MVVTIMDKILKSQVKNLIELELYEFDNRYVCDKEGNVYLIKNQDTYFYYCKPMRPFLTYDGYVEYVLTTKHGSKKHIQAQRIVCGLYIPKPPHKDYVNHKDLNRTNNHVNNLEWVTHSENVKHSYLNNKNRKPIRR